MPAGGTITGTVSLIQQRAKGGAFYYPAFTSGRYTVDAGGELKITLLGGAGDDVHVDYMTKHPRAGQWLNACRSASSMAGASVRAYVSVMWPCVSR